MTDDVEPRIVVPDEVLVFVAEREGVVRRALARATMSSLVLTALVLYAVLTVRDDDITVGQLAGLAVGLGLFGGLCRFDIWALRFGRRVRYEISAEEFVAFRGRRERTRFRFEDVEDWYDTTAINPSSYYTNGTTNGSLPSYAFRMKPRDRFELGRMVRPPALLRWQDRGGLEDVSAALRDRLGRPINGG